MRAGLVAGCFLLTACGREEIRVYDAPKDVAPGAPAGTAMGALSPGASPRTATPMVSWQLPPDWQERPAGAMRVGYFVVPGPNGEEAEITIIPLVGTGGRDLDNVNRWRAQVGLEPVTAEQLARLAVEVPIGGFRGPLYDLVGEGYESRSQRTLAAILRHEGTAWFFKMTGPAQLVGDQKGAFVEFLRTLRFGGAGDAVTTGVAEAPSRPPTGAAAAFEPSQAGGGGVPRFTPPAHWQVQPPGAMQVARYLPGGAETGLEVSVARLPGDGGGRLANVNRWRRQLGLGPIGEAELARVLETRRLA